MLDRESEFEVSDGKYTACSGKHLSGQIYRENILTQILIAEHFSWCDSVFI